MLSRSGVLRHTWGYMVGKGVRDVLGWSGEDFLGKGLGGIVEESSQDVLGVSRGKGCRTTGTYIRNISNRLLL